ncbi:MAG: fructose bisphosphate aldolase, partial [Rhodobacterales bacterium]
GVHLLKEIDRLAEKLEIAVSKGIFGTKMRSVINKANEKGINDVVNQQFEISQKIISHKLIPIIEPEITISITDKEKAEQILMTAILENLNKLPDD